MYEKFFVKVKERKKERQKACIKFLKDGIGRSQG